MAGGGKSAGYKTPESETCLQHMCALRGGDRFFMLEGKLDKFGIGVSGPAERSMRAICTARPTR